MGGDARGVCERRSAWLDERLPAKAGEDAKRHAPVRAQAEDRRLRGHGANRQQTGRFGNLDVAQRLVEDDEIRQLAGGFDDRLEPRARGQHPGAGGAQMLFALLAGRGIGVGHEDVRSMSATGDPGR